MNRLMNRVSGNLIVQLMKRSESSEYTGKIFKFLADLTDIDKYDKNS